MVEYPRKNGIPSLLKRQRGKIKALLINPETLLSNEVRTVIAASPPCHIVFDEVHTVVEWGNSFRPSFLEAVNFVQSLSFRRLTAFTATATPGLLSEITSLLFPDGDFSITSKSPARPNIAFSIKTSICKEADIRTLFLEDQLELPAIIFCATRNETENTARLLLPVLGASSIRFYHAGLSREEKSSVEQWFSSGDKVVLCATCAFGLGVDCHGVRTVLHRTPPRSVEAYIQEAGRAGRDGKRSSAILLLDRDDLTFDDESSYDNRRCVFVAACVQPLGCRRAALMQLFSATEQHSSCGICDQCRAEPHSWPAGAREILSLIDRYPGIYTLSEASELLKGYRTHGTNDLLKSHTPFFGALSHWNLEWCHHAIEQLSADNLIRESFSWKKGKPCPLRCTAAGRRILNAIRQL